MGKAWYLVIASHVWHNFSAGTDTILHILQPSPIQVLHWSCLTILGQGDEIRGSELYPMKARHFRHHLSAESDTLSPSFTNKDALQVWELGDPTPKFGQEVGLGLKKYAVRKYRVGFLVLPCDQSAMFDRYSRNSTLFQTDGIFTIVKTTVMLRAITFASVSKANEGNC